MKNNTMTHATLLILIAIVFITVIVMVLTGENGIINQEIDKYNETHMEENQEKQEENLLIVKN